MKDSSYSRNIVVLGTGVSLGVKCYLPLTSEYRESVVSVLIQFLLQPAVLFIELNFKVLQIFSLI